MKYLLQIVKVFLIMVGLAFVYTYTFLIFSLVVSNKYLGMDLNIILVVFSVILTHIYLNKPKKKLGKKDG